MNIPIHLGAWFKELRDQALKMGLYGSEKANAAIDSTFVHAYSRRKKKSIEPRK